MTMHPYKDNANRPIIAFDFDKTITTCDRSYPTPGPLRPFTREVINFLHSMGVVVTIWTCREGDHKHIMNEYLIDNRIHYDGCNTTWEFAPYEYESRKIYAHMYVDDRGFGWTDKPDIMIDVLAEFMEKIMKIDANVICTICNRIRIGEEINIHEFSNSIHRWWV